MKIKQLIENYWLGFFIGLILGGIVYAFQSTEWKAQALVEPATYTATTIINNDLSQIQLLESTAIITERVKTKSFLLAVSKRLKIVKQDVGFLANAIEIKVTRTRSTDEIPALIITATASSGPDATEVLEAFIQELQFKHQKELNLYKQDILNKLAVVDEQIATNTKSIMYLENLTSGDKSANAGNISESKALLTIVLQQGLLEKKLQSARLHVLISDFNLRNTHLLEPIFLKEQRIFNSLAQALIFGAIFGLILNVVLARRKLWLL